MTPICIELKNGKKMNINLYEEIAPITVGNFMHLVRNNFYDGTIFHRVIKNFMSQGGGYVTTESGSSISEKSCSYTIPGEFAENGFIENTLSHTAGVISMARTNDPNSANTQFFLCSNNAEFLDGKYAGFGLAADEESLANMEELNSISTSDVGGGFTDFPNGGTIDDITIKTITIYNNYNKQG